jgi:xanthine dehydrogenase accessory factor
LFLVGMKARKNFCEVGRMVMAAPDILEHAAQLVKSRTFFVIATVIETEGSTSARLGAKALFTADGAEIAGWVGGGCAASAVALAATEAANDRLPQIISIDLRNEVLGAGMPCGGCMRVFVEAVIPKPRLWIVGLGRVAETLCRIGALIGFSVVVDASSANSGSFPDAEVLISDNLEYDKLRPEAEDFVVIATQHRGDHQSLLRVLHSEARYVALIASEHRAGLVLSYLKEAGVDECALRRIRAPAGLHLGATTPEEIALEVIAEVQLIRRLGDMLRTENGDASLVHHRSI